MKYYVLFSKHAQLVLGTWVEAENKDNAVINAEFKAACHLPNVVYDECHVVDHENE